MRSALGVRFTGAASPDERAALDASLAAVLEGQDIGREDGYRLIRSTHGSAVPALMLAASQVRDRGKGQVVTYSRKVFLPLTNLCQDRCGYCTFVKGPRQAGARTMTPDEVLTAARTAGRQGCKEALFSLGDHPELRHPEMVRTLARLGYRSMPEYLAAMCRLVTEETGLLPHTNAGLMDHDELLALREVTVSMGTMLESTSERLMERGGAHYGCGTKVPSRRLAMLEEAGKLGIPFTTGILIGIGETPEERVDALLAIREVHRKYGHIQEVIVQNFRAKPDTRMRGAGEPGVLDMVRTIAVARLILGPDMNIQAPPNLTPDSYQMYLFAGINDWGGVSPVTKDFINPEKPWPMIAELREVTESAGFRLRERLAIYPEYLRGRRGRLAPAVAERASAFADDQGLVREDLERW